MVHTPLFNLMLKTPLERIEILQNNIQHYDMVIECLPPMYRELDIEKQNEYKEMVEAIQDTLK